MLTTDRDRNRNWGRLFSCEMKSSLLYVKFVFHISKPKHVNEMNIVLNRIRINASRRQESFQMLKCLAFLHLALSVEMWQRLRLE